MTVKQLIHSDSIVVVSGGGRGITAQCVIRLAERAKCTYVLLGRSSIANPLPEWARSAHDDADLKRHILQDLAAAGEKPSPADMQRVFKKITAQREILDTLDSIQKTGARADYLSVDITDGAAVQAALADCERRLGKISGIIHGAGNLADKLIEKKTVQDFETVYSPKVTGLQNLIKAIPVSQLDFLVLFSSIVGFFGNIGQTDYAIANEILNKTAHVLQRQNPQTRVIAIDWGPWEAGMVTPELKRAFEERGVEIIPVETGARMMINELLPDEHHPVQVVVGSMPVHAADHQPAELQTYQIRRRLTLEENPFLLDHQIGSRPVLPATCGATWAVHAIEQLYPGYFFHYLKNFRVLKGIVFDDSLADEYTLDIQETAKNDDDTIDFKALIWSKNPRGRMLYHYTVEVRLGKSMPPAPELPLPQTSAVALISGKQLYENGTLFHGPAFQGVSQLLEVTSQGLLMECKLPSVAARVQGQFPVITGNPFLYDAIVQSVLIWAQYISHAPCLPSRVDRFEQFKAVPFDSRVIVDMRVVSRTENAVLTDVIVQDEEGAVCVRITRLEGTISPQLNRLIGVKPTAEGVELI